MDRGDETEFINRKREHELPKPKNQRPLKILLVEDNLLNQKFAITSLQRAGHAVDVAEHGKAAVEKFKKSKYDLILMDIAMPIMDGIEATRVIRGIEMEEQGDFNPEERIKIVAVTAHVMVTDRENVWQPAWMNTLQNPIGHRSSSPLLRTWGSINL